MPELTLLEKVFVFLQHIVPHHWLSRLTGMLADSEIKAVKDFLIKQFINQFDVDMSEAENPDPTSYKSFNQFFVRPLKEGVRPIDENEDAFCSPADGAVSEFGEIKNDRLIQAKGYSYDLLSLVGDDSAIAEPFSGGNFATIYLSPRDYHRVHMPFEGKLVATRYIPGKLFSVNDVTANSVPYLFARNERLVCLFETDKGPMVMILVGAMIVAGIETVWSGQITPLSKIATTTRFDQDVELEKGQEMGRFKLGSTVIILSPKDQFTFDDLNVGQKLRMGEAIARVN